MMEVTEGYGRRGRQPEVTEVTGLRKLRSTGAPARGDGGDGLTEVADGRHWVSGLREATGRHKGSQEVTAAFPGYKVVT